jgi:hypothetical protein
LERFLRCIAAVLGLAAAASIASCSGDVHGMAPPATTTSPPLTPRLEIPPLLAPPAAREDVLRAEKTMNDGGGPAPPPVLRPVFDVWPSSIELGDVPVGQAQTATLSILDTGQQDLQGTARARGVFQTSGSPFGLGPGTAFQVTVFFAPAAAQSYTDAVLVDIGATEVRVPVHGNGTGPLVTNVPTSFTLTSSSGQVTCWKRQTEATDCLFRATTTDGLTTIRYSMTGRIADGARFGTLITAQGSAIPVQIYIPDIGAGTIVEFDQGAGFMPLGTMSEIL